MRSQAIGHSLFHAGGRSECSELRCLGKTSFWLGLGGRGGLHSRLQGNLSIGTPGPGVSSSSGQMSLGFLAKEGSEKRKPGI
jgi:hypothetical protein